MKGVKNESPEKTAPSNWSDVGRVTLSWVRRSLGDTRVRSTSSNIYNSAKGIGD
jgi:hypothetical protein